MQTASIQEKISTAAKAVETFDQKISALEDAEREATRAFAQEPTEARAAKAREARTTLESWRAGRACAMATLEEARAEQAAQERAAKVARLVMLEAECSRAGMHARLAPLLAELVEAARAVQRIGTEIEATVISQDAAVQEANALAIELDREPTAKSLGISFAQLCALLAMHDAQIAGWVHSWLLSGDTHAAEAALGTALSIPYVEGRPSVLDRARAHLEGRA